MGFEVRKANPWSGYGIIIGTPGMHYKDCLYIPDAPGCSWTNFFPTATLAEQFAMDFLV